MKYLKCLIFVAIILIGSGCDLSGSQKEEESNVMSEQFVLMDLTADSDGDGMKDFDEIRNGRNWNVADIPQFEMGFLQNYRIEIKWKLREFEDEDTEDDYSTYTIDTSVRENDPGFKYQVGDLMLRETATRSAAQIAQYKSHVYGNIPRHDLSRVRYPTVDSLFYQRHAAAAGKFFFDEKYLVSDISLKLKSRIRLIEGQPITAIKNLKVRYLYYDYKKSKYSVIAEQVIQRQFLAGVREEFEVDIEFAPDELIKDNYLRKGEFIIAEIVDYDMPELKMKYSQYKRAVDEKTIPVVVTTPQNTKVYHVSLDKNKRTFSAILRKIFQDDFTILNNNVEKIGPWKNNLPDFEFLREVKDKSKQGRWFVVTNPLPRNYLNHEFTSGDFVYLSYIMGRELALQENEKIHGMRSEISGGKSSRDFSLGQVSVNSKIQLYVQANRSNGYYSSSIPILRGHTFPTGSVHGPCTCDSGKFTPTPLRDKFMFRQDASGEFRDLYLVIGNIEYSIKELVEKKSIDIQYDFTNDEMSDEDIELFGNVKGMHLTIMDITKIQDIVEYKDTPIRLRIKTRVETSPRDHVVWHTGGHVDCVPICVEDIMRNLIMTGKTDGGISYSSENFDHWKGWIPWGFSPWPGAVVPPKIKDLEYSNEFFISVSSLVTKYYN